MIDGATPLRTVSSGPRTGLRAVLFALGFVLMTAPFLVVLAVAA